jgi:hypothetical protein
MNIAEMPGVPVADSAPVNGFTKPKCSIPVTPEHEAEQGRRRRSWVWTAFALATAIALGFGVGTLVTAQRTAAASPTPRTSLEGAPANVGSFAELFTALHLTGLAPAADMSPLYVGEPTQAATGIWISRSAAVALAPLGEDLWAVTVAVDALEMVAGAYESVGIQYFDVAVDNSGDHPIAVSAPARVPAPGLARPSNWVPEFAGPVPPDQLAAVAAFFGAHLAGHGELARYVSATALIPTFPTPPYESVSIGEATSDSLGRVRIELDAATALGGLHRLEYVTEMTFERGVWEVSGLAPLTPEGR